MTAAFALAFPAIDPVAFSIGPLAVRWYALAYIAGLLLGWRYVRLLAARGGAPLDRRQADDLLFWAALGTILGGRVGSTLFYGLDGFFSDPLRIVRIWEGGMSFHGGLLGVAAALAWFARKEKLPPLAVADTVAPAVPIGLFFGRIANFVNGELYGRVSDAPWAMVFPAGGAAPRHPSQLYEAALEGAALFAILAWITLARRGPERRGLATGAFLAGYAVFRIAVETLREPDAHIGFLAGGVTMGQLLSAPMLAAGLWLIWRARHPARGAGAAP